MRKSIFFKYFSITAAILFVSFLIFSVILVVFSRNQWISDKNELLTGNVKTISMVTASTLADNSFSDSMQDFLIIDGDMIGADIYIADIDGNYVGCSHGAQADCMHKNTTIDSGIMQQALNGRYERVSTMRGLYQKDFYTVGTSIYYRGQTVGAVFASVPFAEMDVYLEGIIRIILICAVIVMGMAFIAIYIASAQMTRPIRLMAQAARNMEKGNFLQRIPVERHDEIGLLAEEFNTMAKSLSSLESMRRSFISSVSHELKTPMTTISGFIDGILDGTIPPAQQTKYLNIVSDETKRLSRLVNSMLQLSKLESETVVLNKTTFNVTDLLMRVLFSFEHRIDEKRLDIRGLEQAASVQLTADSDLIYQVLYNLVENAIKFTPAGGYIELSVALDKNAAHLKIKNSGEGLTEQELNRIFERFYKTDRSRSEDKTGMGFGLYIVKTIVGLHGGTVRASSVYGSYTCFEVTLPGAQGVKSISAPQEL